jgi:activator of HSP90 ATPase
MRIHQEVKIDATPDAVFDVLTDSAQFKAMTGGKAAQISREAGGSISMFDGYVSGRQIELSPAKRVVQAWRGANWPEGDYSIVRFELTKDGDGTKLTFDQIGHPVEHQPHLETGWSKMYWEPMQAHLAKK